MFLFLIFFVNFSQAAPVPENKKGTELGLDLRVIKKINKFSLLVEHIERKELESLHYTRTNVGSYYRLHRNLKLGLFYWNEEGNRRDEDWKKIVDQWQWKQVNQTTEHSLVLDVTPMSETPITNLVFDWKNRFVHNLSNGRNLLRSRPGLTYLIFKDDKPMLSLFNQYEFYLPLDYGRKTVYERWIYLGGLYHFSKNILAGPYYSRRTRFWKSTDDFSKNFGNEYTNKFSSNFFGLTVDFIF